MIASRNQRVYLVLDPDEATELQTALQRSILVEAEHREEHTLNRKQHRILRRLEAAMERAKEKGAKFAK